jgi:hypothetical protein
VVKRHLATLELRAVPSTATADGRRRLTAPPAGGQYASDPVSAPAPAVTSLFRSHLQVDRARLARLTGQRPKAAASSLAELVARPELR